MDSMPEMTAAQFAQLVTAEREYESKLLSILSDFNNHSIDIILEAYKVLYQLVELIVPRDFNNAKDHEDALWNAHHLGQKQFHKALKHFRKNNPSASVETRAFIQNYMKFLKQSEKFYRSYIGMLSAAAGGIPELEVIAHTAGVDGDHASAQVQITPSHHDKVISSCLRALISLGDLSRYRASEKLDKEPDFGPALGYYGLAATLKPSNGVGHHQQAVVALAQTSDLRAVYHLYRSITVADPHPHGKGNLGLEMEKLIEAFDRGELIERRTPRDPDADNLSLIGWFLRFHSKCYKGKPLPEHNELEREVLGQFTAVLRHRSLDITFTRMIMVNLSAQYIAGQRFQASPTPTHQQAFLKFFRMNLRTFHTLLSIFCDDLRSLLVGLVWHDCPLISKLTKIGCRLLPLLRLYSNWLRYAETIPMLAGFINTPDIDEAIAGSAAIFWPLYARAIDLVTQAFPVWEMEEQVQDVTYMLEEDVETFGFLPVTDEDTRQTWYNKATGSQKPRFSDRVVRLSSEEEMLWRMKDFQDTGLYLALEVRSAPLSISSRNRVHTGDSSNIEPLTVPNKVYAPLPPPVKPKPISYADVAAKGHSATARARPLTVGKTPTQEALAERMVASLVDDDDNGPGTDDNQPITPPQPAFGLSSPRGHVRINSAGSARSGKSLGLVDPWAPRVVPASGAVAGGQGAEMASPLLFGAGGSLWTPGFGG